MATIICFRSYKRFDKAECSLSFEVKPMAAEFEKELGKFAKEAMV